MAIDWGEFEKDVASAANTAGKRTDEQLAGKLSSVTRLTDDEVMKLFPDPADAQKLANLVQIVRSAGDRNDKINKIVKGAETLGKIILTLLDKFI
jgi:hypothetical protein